LHILEENNNRVRENMEFFELKDISERFFELLNPTSTEKILQVGEILGFKPGSRVIDFGCGFGECLVLWAENFGINGVGIDIRPYACERAKNKIKCHGLDSRIEIICGDAAEYRYEPESFDSATCIGATFIWGNLGQAIRGMKPSVKPGAKLAIGECHLLKSDPPAEYIKIIGEIFRENDLLRFARDEGYDFEYVIRSTHEDWDRLECSNWQGLLRWIEENSDHPERDEVIKHLHASQDEYLTWGREYLGWAIYILN
jgi:ubiquinone/menaquinone biosynthesis C-methylase UbiE